MESAWVKEEVPVRGRPGSTVEGVRVCLTWNYWTVRVASLTGANDLELSTGLGKGWLLAHVVTVFEYVVFKAQKVCSISDLRSCRPGQVV